MIVENRRETTAVQLNRLRPNFFDGKFAGLDD